MDLYELREEYMLEKLEEASVPETPFILFEKWFNQALEAKMFEPNAMALATADRFGKPSVRMLLLKAFNEKGFIFFTNYESLKGRHLTENHKAAICFYWSDLERQVRICGQTEKLTSIESDSYFRTRPTGSRLGAWASPQSTVINNRQWLEDKHNEFREKFKHGEIQRPNNWGGYILIPETVEFWQGRQNRLHDRVEYYCDGDRWKTRRLAP